MNSEYQQNDAMKGMIVTIDGPAGSGKSTTASILAERLGLAYLDTGAMYRCVTLAVLKAGVDPEDENGVSEILSSMGLEMKRSGGSCIFLLDGNEVGREIRGKEVSDAVSAVSRHRKVRSEMVKLQRKLSGAGGIVAEGRDLGTVVFPFAHVKIFLVAGIDARVERRCAQLDRMGIEYKTPEIRENIEKRDKIDSGRDISPLVKPPGSFIIDTSRVTIEEQVDLAEKKVREISRILTDSKISYLSNPPSRSMSLYYRISKAAVRFFFKVFFGLRVDGSQNLEFGDNFIFASNHISYGDPPIVGAALDREISFLAKKELFSNRFLAWLISAYHALPIDRDNLDRRALTRVIGQLKDGGSVLMFPQGTRSRGNELAEVKTGLGFIALRSKTDIIPVYITGSADLAKCLFRREKLEVRIGPPIRIHKDYKPEDRKRDYEIISSMVLEEIRMLRDER